MSMNKKILFFCSFFIIHICQAEPLSLIRDTEAEFFLSDYAKRAAKAAHLSPQNTRVILINDDDINAFVAGGQTIFIHTGLLTHATAPDDVMFVLAHETGHIKGGHVIRGQLAYEKTQMTALISTAIGGILAIATGQPEAGIAMAMGGQSSALGAFTHYRQTEESVADRTALDIMQETHFSMLGLKNIMEEIKKQERLNPYAQNTYYRTHPLTQSRVQDLNRFLKNPLPLTVDSRFNRVKAKLIAFLYPPERTKSLYSGEKIEDRYARVIADYRSHQVQTALNSLDQLIAEEPSNPYFYELKGQIFFETGQLDKAVPAYQKAIDLCPKSALMPMLLAQVLLEMGDFNQAQKAFPLLKKSLNLEPDLTEAWRFMASAYEQTKQPAFAEYAMCEYYDAMGQHTKAQELAKRTLKKLSAHSKEALKLKDILNTKY